MREIRTLRAMWRGLETGSRCGFQGTPNGNGEQQLGRTYGMSAPVLDPPAESFEGIVATCTGCIARVIGTLTLRKAAHPSNGRRRWRVSHGHAVWCMEMKLSCAAVHLYVITRLSAYQRQRRTPVLMYWHSTADDA